MWFFVYVFVPTVHIYVFVSVCVLSTAVSTSLSSSLYCLWFTSFLHPFFSPFQSLPFHFPSTNLPLTFPSFHFPLPPTFPFFLLNLNQLPPSIYLSPFSFPFPIPVPLKYPFHPLFCPLYKYRCNMFVLYRSNMFELADRLVGIYKTYNCTKSVTINPDKIGQPTAQHSINKVQSLLRLYQQSDDDI